MLLQHGQNLVQAVDGDAGGGATRAGIAGGTHQGLQLHQQGPGALAGHDRGGARTGALPTEEQLAGIGHLRQPLPPHLEHAQLMGGTEAVLHRPQQPVAGEAIPLEGEHRIDQMLQHLGAGEGPLLGHMADQHQGRVLALGDAGQGSGTLAHLGHRARRTGQLSVMQGLDAVDDRHRRPQRLQLLQHQLQIGLSEQLQP